MYIISLERIPLPQLSTYVYISFYSFITSILYLFIDNLYVKNFEVKTNSSIYENDIKSPIFISLFNEFLNDSWCFWSFINLAYCALLIIGRMFQDVFFGELRPEEQSHIIEKFWNFVFYKLVFIYGILNVQTLHELLLWTGWSSILGFLHLLTNLAKERYEFMIQSVKISMRSHIKIIALLIIILLAGNLLTSISIWVGVKYSYHLMFFMGAEVFQLTGITIYVLINYGIYFYINDDSKASLNTNKSKLIKFLERKKWFKGFNQLTAQYYTEFYYAIIAHVVDFLHNLHMLLWNNIKINMTGLVIGMHLQYLYYDLSKRYSRHIFYLKVVRYIENNFPLINKGVEKCAICWESLFECRRLVPCGHLFHDACLRLWLESSIMCPACKCTIIYFNDKSEGEIQTINQQENMSRLDWLPEEQNTERMTTNSSGFTEHRGERENQSARNNKNDRFTQSQESALNSSQEQNGTEQTEGVDKNQYQQSFNASLLNGKANYIHSMYPAIPLDKIYHNLINENGDMEKVVAKIQNGQIRGVHAKFYTGPMQVELAAGCHDDHEFMKPLLENNSSTTSILTDQKSSYLHNLYAIPTSKQMYNNDKKFFPTLDQTGSLISPNEYCNNTPYNGNTTSSSVTDQNYDNSCCTRQLFLLRKQQMLMKYRDKFNKKNKTEL